MTNEQLINHAVRIVGDMYGGQFNSNAETQLRQALQNAITNDKPVKAKPAEEIPSDGMPEIDIEGDGDSKLSGNTGQAGGQTVNPVSRPAF